MRWGAILGTVFPFIVRERLPRRWLFEPLPDGGYRLRGERTRNWLGWPKGSPPEKSDPDRGFSATDGQIRAGIEGRPALAPYDLRV